MRLSLRWPAMTHSWGVVSTSAIHKGGQVDPASVRVTQKPQSCACDLQNFQVMQLFIDIGNAAVYSCIS
jgi:hypothetical protein